MVLAHLLETALRSSKRRETLVPPSAGKVVPAPAKVVWLYLVLGTSGLLFLFPPSLLACAAALGLTVVTLCAGHSVGLHRGIIHKTYSCPKCLRGALAYAFVHTGIGGPIGWIHLHYVRDHYQNTRECPRYFRYDHSLARDYFWSLHLRFVPRDACVYRFPSEDEHDPWLRFLERTWPAHVIAFGGALWLTFGPGVALVCVPLRVAVSVLGHWFVGFAAHKRGAIRYDLDGSAEIGRNLPLLGILSFGEGFHNNHHANPASARMGETPLELDLGWYLLLALERLGLVHDIQASGRTPVRRFNARPRVPDLAPPGGGP
jgi:fatty-acid desaturase